MQQVIAPVNHIHTKNYAELFRVSQSMEWTGSIRWIYNPVQSRRIWIGLDQKFTNSADPGLDWIQKCAMCIPYLDLRQFLLIVTLTSEVLPSNLQLFTSSFVFTCRFYKVFGRYLLCCVRIGHNRVFEFRKHENSKRVSTQQQNFRVFRDCQTLFRKPPIISVTIIA